MPDGMGRMIQMITSLAEMQDRRRKLALDEEQLKAQREQAAQQMGFNEKGQRQSAALKLLDSIAYGGVDAHTAAPQLAQMMGFSPEESKLFEQAAPNAQAALQIYSLAQQRQGEQALRQNGQLSNVQQEAYTANQTGGMNRGSVAASGFQQSLANQPFDAQMMTRLADGWRTRQAAGQTVDQFQTSQAFVDQGLGGITAQIGAGVAPNVGQKMQDEQFRAGLLGQLQMAGMRQEGTGPQRIAPADAVNIHNQLRQLLESMADPKNANKNINKGLRQAYNSLSGLIGLDQIPIDGELEAGFFDKAKRKLGAQPAVPGFYNPSFVRPDSGARRY